MVESYLPAGGGWSTLLAVILIVVFLVVVLFAAGKPNDVRGGRWQAYLIGGLLVLGFIFLLSKAVSRLTYDTCTNSTVRCA